MLETVEQIQLTLDIAGEQLEFDNGTLKGIPGEVVYNVQSFDSPYDVYKQDFNFQVSSQAFFDLGLNSGDSFIYVLNNKEYRFKIMSIADDLTGWFNLQVKLTNVRDISV